MPADQGERNRISSEVLTPRALRVHHTTNKIHEEL